MPPCYFCFIRSGGLQLRSGADQRFTCWRIGVFLEVLDEQFRQRSRFFLPLLRRPVGITRVENTGIYTATQSGSPDQTSAG